ncbi:MAG: hypothetical protein J2P31_11305 [Blastocatellia bacterium]|nr:hypothetical protein [Blastocatellia bacterium]
MHILPAGREEEGKRQKAKGKNQKFTAHTLEAKRAKRGKKGKKGMRNSKLFLPFLFVFALFASPSKAGLSSYHTFAF